ncbi:MAG TPA: SDR family oxidoreductase [Acidimicrobiales bacterium]|nr:SDR family oxidoreductase [Acidimicrobiales bacterium]
MELNGSRAVVTGGASGIGAAVVAQLAAAGSRVAVLDLAEPADTPTATSATSAKGSELWLRCDISDEAAVNRAVSEAHDRLGGLDVAVLSAAVGGFGPLLDMPLEEWDRVIAVNLRGSLLSLRAVGRTMVAGGRGGSVVAVSSVSGFLADRMMGHYSVSKAALDQLVRVAARELGPFGIRVNAVAPGTTDTPMFSATRRLPGYQQRVAERAALGGIGTPADVAQAVVALLGLDWVTGQVLAADGGVSLWSPIDPAESLQVQSSPTTGTV